MRSRRFPWFREGFDRYKHETCQHEPIVPNSFFCKKCGEDFSNVKVYSLGGESGYENNIFMPDPIKSAKNATPFTFKRNPLEYQNMAYMFGLDTLFIGVDYGKEEKVREVKKAAKAFEEGLSKLLPSKKRPLY